MLEVQHRYLHRSTPPTMYPSAVDNYLELSLIKSMEISTLTSPMSFIIASEGRVRLVFLSTRPLNKHLDCDLDFTIIICSISMGEDLKFPMTFLTLKTPIHRVGNLPFSSDPAGLR